MSLIVCFSEFAFSTNFIIYLITFNSNSNFEFSLLKQNKPQNPQTTSRKLTRQLLTMQMKRNQSKKDKVVQAFMNHCAIIIQSHFRGYQQRKYYRKFLPLYRRFKQLLYTGFVGWKTRKALKLSIVKNKIHEIKSLKSQQKNLQLRIAKRDFADEISRLLKNDLWLYYYSKQKKVPLAQKAMVNKNQAIVMKKIDLKLAFNIIPKGNKKSIIFKDENEKIAMIPPKKVNSEQPQEISSMNKMKGEKQRKNKRFEDPPKLNNAKTQMMKRFNLKIQTKIEPEVMGQAALDCETPNQVANQLTEFTFHTRPRNQIPRNKDIHQAIHVDIEEPFKQVHVNTNIHKKGLNMTLSKKPIEQKMSQSTSINLSVLNDFTKKKISHKDLNLTKISVNLKEVSIFTTKDEERIVNKDLGKKIEALQSGRGLALQMKKEAFETRKQQFQKKSKQFKAETLK